MSDTTTNTTVTRDEARARIFGAKPDKAVVKDFFGQDIEIRQPSLGVILETRQEDQKAQTARMLIDYTYLPGTDDRLFDAADADAILQIPFGSEMKRYLDEMNKILGVDTAEVEKAITDATKSS